MTDQAKNTEATPTRSVSKGVLAITRRVVEIASIRQTRAKCEFDITQDAIAADVVMAEAPPEYKADHENLRVFVAFEFRAKPKRTHAEGSGDQRRDLTEAPFLVIAAEFAIDYKLRPAVEEQEPTPAEWLGFAEVNGRFNATAYWREFLHSTLARCGLPPYLVKPFNAADRLKRLDSSPTE